ncbi:MAG: DUF4358 domain-containing protein [Oscillospiraceae bacterium]|nr:DUF4358 domain-containing protein [Oscillospiraceae bacterium]
MKPQNMKKIIAAAAAVVMCAMLAACGGDSGSADNSSTSAETTSAAADVSDTEADTETEAEVENGTVEGVTDSANPLQPLADAATSVGEWPALMEVTDPQMLSDFFLLDAGNENYRNMIVLQCPMSATMTELIIIETSDTDAAVSDLEARRQKAIEQDAFYPNDVDLANASIVGTEGDYAYFILAWDAAEAEKALAEAVKAL